MGESGACGGLEWVELIVLLRLLMLLPHRLLLRPLLLAMLLPIVVFRTHIYVGPGNKVLTIPSTPVYVYISTPTAAAAFCWCCLMPLLPVAAGAFCCCRCSYLLSVVVMTS